MDQQTFKEILQFGHEVPGVEFKAPGRWDDKSLRASIVRAILAMGNRRGGGRVIIGVVEGSDKQLEPRGFEQSEISDWNHDGISGVVSGYADPYVDIKTDKFEFEGKFFLDILVNEFEEVPVLCKKDYQDVLRAGACYVRRRGKPESSEIPNQSEMRDLLSLATEKGLRRFIQLTYRAGIRICLEPETKGADKFREQVKDFL